MPQTYHSLNCHVVFSTKHRQSFITREIRPRLYLYIGGLIRDRACVPRAIGGVENHVHLLVSLTQLTVISDLMRDVKAISSGWVRQTFTGYKDFEWQPGYGVFAVSHSAVRKVRNYIEGQEEYHRVKSFKEEFVGLLDEHEIKYDRRYLWE
jgi:putative transposase